MKTIFKAGMYKIIGLFYENRNKPIHLREISRRTKLNESTITTHLNSLLKENILKYEKEGNMKKFRMNTFAIPGIFPIFDTEKLEKLPLLRRNAIKEYLKNLEKKPLLAIVFGSTAKQTFNDESDIDILEVYQQKSDNKQAIKSTESLTGVHIQTFQVLEKDFNKDLLEKKDHVLQSAINTGFPVFNKEFFYEEIYHE